ncbi:MAG: hypothetical protein EBR82_72190 [Caulobacteraceae bacterium]|nr:hypothetical protein [Caulobacteraceae bacterium]
MDDLKLLLKGYEEGLVGEKSCRDYLKAIGHKFFQADVISISPSGKYYLWECKNQERFKAPPFDGHGLPIWQVEARLEFYRLTNVRPILWIHEKPSGDIYIQFFDVLYSGKKFITHKSKRVIFPIESFVKK